MYDRILFPTDGSEGADAAFEHAIDHALQYDASLHILHVVEQPPSVIESSPADVFDALEAEGERILEDSRTRAKAADVESIRGMIASGTPHRQILDYVDEYDIDVIVMGTHGRGGVERYLLGSVAEKVVRSADCPVLTVQASTE